MNHIIPEQQQPADEPRDVMSLWRAPAWSTSSRVEVDGVWHALDAAVTARPWAGDENQAIGVQLHQRDAITTEGERVRVVRQAPVVLLEGLTLTIDEADDLSRALARFVAAVRGGVR